MRKFVLVLLVISMIFSFGCSVAETPDNEQTEDNGGISGDMTNENPSDLHGDKESSDVNSVENIESGMYIDSDAGILLDIGMVQGFYDGNLIYTKSSSDEFNSADGGPGLIDFCKYNISTGESKVLGSALASYSSGDVSVINGNMYVFEGGGFYDEVSSEWKTEVSLLEIGLTDDSFRVVTTENLYASVVWHKSCGDYIISVRKAEDEIRYLGRINPKIENAEFEVLINLDVGSSVLYKNFGTDAEKIYVLFEQVSEDHTVSHYINIYNINGELLDRKDLSSDVSSFITGSGQFELSAPKYIELSVFGHYLMISSNDDGYVLDLSTDNLETVFTTYGPRVSVSSKEFDDIYLFSSLLGKVWKYDRESDKIIELSGKFEGITCMRVCEDDIIVQADGKVYYFPDGSFIVEE